MHGDAYVTTDTLVVFVYVHCRLVDVSAGLT